MEEFIKKLVKMSAREERIYWGYADRTQARPLMAKARRNLLSELLAYAETRRNKEKSTAPEVDFKVGDMVVTKQEVLGISHRENIPEGALCQIVLTHLDSAGYNHIVKVQQESTGILAWAARSELSPAETKLSRFHEAQEGDLVYCMVHGEGVIKELIMDLNHDRISCYFPLTGKIYTRYQTDGRISKDVGDPVLFYRKGSEKYLTERPKPDTDWTKVSKGTKVRVWDSPENKQAQIFVMYLPDEEYKFLTYATASGKSIGTSSVCEDIYVAWKNAEVL